MRIDKKVFWDVMVMNHKMLFASMQRVKIEKLAEDLEVLSRWVEGITVGKKAILLSLGSADIEYSSLNGFEANKKIFLPREIEWIWELNIRSSDKIILLYLVTHAVKDISCIGINEIAIMTNISTTKVKECLKRLENQGVLEKLHREGIAVNCYRW